MSEIYVSGLADLQKLLDQLPAKVEKNIMRGALRAGANPIKQAAISAVPVGKPSTSGAKKYHLYEGALKDSIRISSSSKGGKVSTSIKAGGKHKGVDVWYAHIIEFTGAVEHKIKPKHGGSLFFGGLFYKSIDHPGMYPKPFLRPALDSQGQNAVIAIGNYIKKRLATKEGLDTSDITIEGDE